MSTSAVPALLARLVDDAAVFPPGNAPLPEAVTGHRAHRRAWYRDLVGPLLLPVRDLAGLARLAQPAERLAVGVIGELPELVASREEFLAVPAPAGSGAAPGMASGRDGVVVRQVEAPVAKRGEDPLPGLRDLLALAATLDGMDAYAEIPLSLGLLDALDQVADARAGGARVAPKFRTGGLAAELFPTPVELAAVICACRDRNLPFKLTAGLHHAIRSTDPETGFTHHGFLNILAATLAVADGAEVVDVAERLASTEPAALVAAVGPRCSQVRPLWVGFGSCSVAEPLSDLGELGLLDREVLGRGGLDPAEPDLAGPDRGAP